MWISKTDIKKVLSESSIYFLEYIIEMLASHGMYLKGSFIQVVNTAGLTFFHDISSNLVLDIPTNTLAPAPQCIFYFQYKHKCVMFAKDKISGVELSSKRHCCNGIRGKF